MFEPKVFIAADPSGRGVHAAVFCFSSEEDVFGWFTGARGPAYPASFFMLEDFYSAGETRCYRSAEDDVYGDWLAVRVHAGKVEEHAVDRPIPVPDEVCHELDRIQDMFVREWLFFANDAEAEADRAAYREQGLTVEPVNIRPKRLGKLEPRDSARIFTTDGFDLQVVDYLAGRWPLDYSRI